MSNKEPLEITIEGNGKTYTGMDGFIASQRDLLRLYRDDGRVPSQDLLDDIAAYEFMLDAKLVRKYIDWKSGKSFSTKYRPRLFPPFVKQFKSTPKTGG